jgi:hypothetical protein
MTTYRNEITKELFKAVKIADGGVVFQNIETKEEKFYTDHQIGRFITPIK